MSEKKLPAVDPNTRALNYTSVSAVSKFDHSDYGGCHRRWYFRYVQGLPEPFTGSQQKGVEVHAQIEHYLKTGEDVLGAIARAGRHHLPPTVLAGADLRVEWGLNDKPKPPPVDGREVAWFDPAESLLDADGVPFIGFFDWLHVDGGVVEVGDNKTTSDLKWAKEGRDLIKTVQMAGYAEWARRKFPQMTKAVISHVYFQTKGPRAAKKATDTISVATVAGRWQEVRDVVQRMKEVARLDDWREVPGNSESCSAYKGCPFQRNCFKSPLERMKNMGLLDKVVGSANGASARVQEPAAMKPPPPPPPMTKSPPVAEVAPPSAASGARSIPPIPPKVRRLAIKDAPAASAPRPPDLSTEKAGLTAKDARQGNIYILPGGTEGVFLFAKTDANEYHFIAPTGGAVSILAADVGIAETVRGAPPPAPPKEAIVASAPAQAASRAIPPPPTAKAKPEAPVPAPWKAEEPKVPEPAKEEKAARKRNAHKEGSPQVAEPLFRLFVNCVPNAPHQMLDGYVSKLTGEIQEQFKVDDVRLPLDKNSPLAYGGWRGVVAACVRATPPAEGLWVAFTKGNEIAEVVVEALSATCAPGALVRGF